MSDVAEQAELNDRALAELLELGLSAARQVQARLLSADDVQEVCDLSLAFNRISRAVRQTIALQAKLERERKREAREDARDAQQVQQARASRREAQVRATVERAIWTEAEPDEADRLIDELDDLISEEALYDGFGEEPIAAHIERIRVELGLPSASPMRSAVAGRALDAPGGAQPSRAPQALGGGAPSGGASLTPDQPWRSSA